MKIVNSNVATEVVKQVESKFGQLHLFNKIAVVEFNEGVHIDLKAFKNTINEINSYFNNKPFGLVANRVNSYSISLLDLKSVHNLMPNMKAYGIVTHDEAGLMNAVIESNFCGANNISFDNLYEGLYTVYNRVKQSIPYSLN